MLSSKCHLIQDLTIDQTSIRSIIVNLLFSIVIILYVVLPGLFYFIIIILIFSEHFVF